jgi:hypothetical protein
VVDARGEVHFRGLERVVGREMDCEEEDAARVRRVALDDMLVSGLPLVVNTGVAPGR